MDRDRCRDRLINVRANLTVKVSLIGDRSRHVFGEDKEIIEFEFNPSLLYLRIKTIAVDINPFLLYLSYRLNSSSDRVL